MQQQSHERNLITVLRARTYCSNIRNQLVFDEISPTVHLWSCPIIPSPRSRRMERLVYLDHVAAVVATPNAPVCIPLQAFATKQLMRDFKTNDFVVFKEAPASTIRIEHCGPFQAVYCRKWIWQILKKFNGSQLSFSRSQPESFKFRKCAVEKSKTSKIFIELQKSKPREFPFDERIVLGLSTSFFADPLICLRIQWFKRYVIVKSKKGEIFRVQKRGKMKISNERLVKEECRIEFKENLALRLGDMQVIHVVKKKTIDVERTNHGKFKKSSSLSNDSWESNKEIDKVDIVNVKDLPIPVKMVTCKIEKYINLNTKVELFLHADCLILQVNEGFHDKGPIMQEWRCRPCFNWVDFNLNCQEDLFNSMKGMRDESMNLIHSDLFEIDDGYQDKIHDHVLIERYLSDIVHDDHYEKDLVDMVQKLEIGQNNRLLDSVGMGSENRLLKNIRESNIDCELGAVDKKIDFYGKGHVHIAYHENYGQDLMDIVYRKTASVLAGEKHEDIPCEVIELVDDLVNDVDKLNHSPQCIESKDGYFEGSSADEDFIFCEHNDVMEDFVAGCYDFVK
uniref:Uncharacterized protein n=1 Tax=Romanomermis culicivorax TaxID=13658 RepID=A0A915KQ16_ROMCU